MFRTFTQWVRAPFKPTDATLAADVQVGDYMVERNIHRGGMSWVYKARDYRGIAVVLKEFFPSSSAMRLPDGRVVAQPGKEDFYREAFRRFHEEARVVSLFRGPTFPRPRQFFRAFDTAYIVMELERGRSLSVYSRTPRKPVEWAVARPYILDVHQSVLNMHEQNILHLDLHPANIFLTLQGRAVLLDYGATRHAAEPILNSARFYTAGFSAPEIKMGAQWGTWSDVYSFGACLRAAGALRNPLWPAEVRRLTLDCMREDIGTRIHRMDDPAFRILQLN